MPPPARRTKGGRRNSAGESKAGRRRRLDAPTLAVLRRTGGRSYSTCSANGASGSAPSRRWLRKASTGRPVKVSGRPLRCTSSARSPRPRRRPWRTSGEPCVRLSRSSSKSFGRGAQRSPSFGLRQTRQQPLRIWATRNATGHSSGPGARRETLTSSSQCALGTPSMSGIRSMTCSARATLGSFVQVHDLALLASRQWRTRAGAGGLGSWRDLGWRRGHCGLEI